MATFDYYPLPREQVATIRGADLFTGRFPVPPKSACADGLRRMGLVTEGQPRLTDLGMAVREWLMIGAPSAPEQVASLLDRPANRLSV